MQLAVINQQKITNLLLFAYREIHIKEKCRLQPDPHKFEAGIPPQIVTYLLQDGDLNAKL